MQNLEKRILSKVGKPVKFKYPDGTLRPGTLKDRVVLPTQGALSGKVYFDVIDLIEFEDEGESIRFDYYIYENRKLRWGSQTTLTESKETILILFQKACREKSWFRELIEKSMI